MSLLFNMLSSLKRSILNFFCVDSPESLIWETNLHKFYLRGSQIIKSIVKNSQPLSRGSRYELQNQHIRLTMIIYPEVAYSIKVYTSEKPDIYFFMYSIIVTQILTHISQMCAGNGTISPRIIWSHSGHFRWTQKIFENFQNCPS